MEILNITISIGEKRFMEDFTHMERRREGIKMLVAE